MTPKEIYLTQKVSLLEGYFKSIEELVAEMRAKSSKLHENSIKAGIINLAPKGTE